jgi:hypothetical protein
MLTTIIENVESFFSSINDTAQNSDFNLENELNTPIKESYKVDSIKIYKEELQHIKVNSLCILDRWGIIKTAIVGNESVTLKFYHFDNCTLSDIEFSIVGDIFTRRYALQYY